MNLVRVLGLLVAVVVANPLYAASQELVMNGSFASGSASYVLSGAMQADTRFSTFHNGPGYAYLSLADGSPGDNLLGSIYQQISIPANASSATLRFWCHITSTDSTTTPYDVLSLNVRDSGGTILATIATYSNTFSPRGSYAEQVLDLTPYKGQSVQLFWLGTTDSTFPTSFRIDDISVVAVTPAAALTIGPSTLPLGDVAVGSSNQQDFIVQHQTGTDPATYSFSVSGTGYSIVSGASGSLSNGQSSPVTVRFAPSSTGASTGSATISTTATTNIGSVSLTGNGVSAPSSYTLTVVDGSGSGTYSSDSTVAITATSYAGYAFDRWEGAAVADPLAASTTLTMPSSNATVTARFRLTQFALTVASGSGSGTYTEGASVPITANAPPAGKVFDSWIGSGVVNPNASSTTVTMPSQNTTVTATYRDIAVPAYSLVVVNGTGDGNYAQGQVVTISADVAPSGQIFDKWTGGAVADANASTTTVTVPASNLTVTATYKSAPPPPPAYTLTVVNGQGSTSAVAGSTLPVSAGAPPSGQAFDRWLGPVADALASSTTVLLPAFNLTITATFKAVPPPPPPPVTYTLQVENGTGSGTYTQGSIVSIEALAPFPNAVFISWTGANVAEPFVAKTTLTLTVNSTVRANFAEFAANAPPDLTSRFYREDNIFWQSGFAPNSSSPQNPQLGFALGNCTWFVWGRLLELGYSREDLIQIFRDASKWDDMAIIAGIPVSATPIVGAIAQTDAGAGGLGHVAVVEEILSDGRIVVSESSYAGNNPSPTSTWNFLYRKRTVTATWFQRFIHVRSTPKITNFLTASAPSGGAVSINLVASGSGPITWTASGLPSGLVVSGDKIIGTAVQSGKYDVQITATSLFGSVTKTMTLYITGQGISKASVDTDGDGFSDEIETGLKTSPFDASSVPIPGPFDRFEEQFLTANSTTAVLSKFGIRLRFGDAKLQSAATTGRDKITVKGALPIPAGFDFSAEEIFFNVGGVGQGFTLNAKGAAKLTGASFKFAKPKKGIAKFQMKLSGSFGVELYDEGLVPDRVVGEREVPVEIIFNDALYIAHRSLVYRSNGKSGVGR